MKNRSEQFIPLVVTVGQVAIFPYYIIWLKEVSLTFTLFAWLFAAFSFSAAFGYRIYAAVKNRQQSYIAAIYIGMGFLYLLAGLLDSPAAALPYAALFLQVCLGFLQGYFRAWHIEQKTYRIHAVHQYLTVGAVMIALSFVKTISPFIFIMVFGTVLLICGLWALVERK